MSIKQGDRVRIERSAYAWKGRRPGNFGTVAVVHSADHVEVRMDLNDDDNPRTWPFSADQLSVVATAPAATPLAEQQDYTSVYGEDPKYLHLEDGKRAAYARATAERIEDAWREYDAATLTKPLCPGCAVTLAFNIMSHFVQTQGMNHVEVADAMIRLFTEMKERGPFYTERSGIIRNNNPEVD